MKTINISVHAMDRASLRLMGLWRRQRTEDEGLYTWLQSVASEAMRHEPIDERRQVRVYEHVGVRFTMRGATVITVKRAGGQALTFRPFAALRGIWRELGDG